MFDLVVPLLKLHSLISKGSPTDYEPHNSYVLVNLGEYDTMVLKVADIVALQMERNEYKHRNFTVFL